jgi:hypothetical protein
VKAKQIVGNVDSLTVDRGALLSITLTLPPSSASLTKQMKSLLAAFKKLTRQAPWKHTIVGGVRCLHAPYRLIDQCWQPHLHILAQGWSVEAKEIADRWFGLTGGYSRIRTIDSEDHRRHMSWYVSKSPNQDLIGQLSRFTADTKLRAKAATGRQEDHENGGMRDRHQASGHAHDLPLEHELQQSATPPSGQTK